MLAKFPVASKVMTCPGYKLLLFLLFISVVTLGNYLMQWALSELDMQIGPLNETATRRLLIVTTIIYMIVMAIPFVPGAEIGLAAMVIIGPDVAPLVYLSTVASLSISFLVGRHIPDKVLISLAHDLNLRKAGQLGVELIKLDEQQRLNLILSRSPKKFIHVLLKHRYLSLLVAINMPGNILIGGGGGIALMAGMSRVFSAPLYLLTIAIAVAPIPLLQILSGEHFTKWLF